MSEVTRVVIVGGVAGGASAAARARRLSENAEIIMFERGEDVSFANCGLPYHIGGTITERKRLLVQTPENLYKQLRIDVRVRTEVTAIDRDSREVVACDHAAGREYREKYDKLILSPGAAPVRPPIPGVDSPLVLSLRNMADMDAINRVLDETKPQRAVVVGGGYIGLEMAEALRYRGLETTLVELAEQVMGPADPEMAAPLHQELRLNGVDLRLGTSVDEFAESDGGLQLTLSTGETLEAGLAILAIGVKPDIPLARDAGLEIGELGGIVVNEHMRTSDPNIYAVGDAVEVRDFVSDQAALIPLAGPANRQGRIAADNIFGRPSVYKKTQGTAICKVFNLAIGMTGDSERVLARNGCQYEKVYVHPNDHAGYYPGASPVSLKLLFDPGDGKILGAQAVGRDGVDKRIDVLATAIRAGLTVFDLEELELAYAPPYGSAKDVINYAGFVAANAMRGDMPLCHVADVTNPRDDQILLDVRNKNEVEAGMIPGAVHIPLPQLRDRLDELPKDKEVLAYCQVGLRGYLAGRVLVQNGFSCRNLTGGYKTYLMATGRLDVAGTPDPATTADRRSPGQEATGTPTQDGDLRSPARAGRETGPQPGKVGPQPQGGAMSDQPQTNFSQSAGAAEAPPVVKHVDVCGLQCPGPIQRLKSEIDAVGAGECLTIQATDPGFAADVPAWCRSTGHQLVEVVSTGTGYKATIVKRSADEQAQPAATADGKKGMTIIVFSNDFDRAMAAFIIANGAATMGFEPTLFFTFWGLNVLRKDEPVKVNKSFVEQMFGFMMPRGPERLALSKMHMVGMGRAMIKGIMKQKNVASLPELIKSAQAGGVRLVACTMSMDLMGIKRAELIDGVDEGGVATYLDHAGGGNVNLFI